jgi:aminotransferase
MINVFQPQLGKEELDAIESVFKSNWIGKGRKTEQFESDFASYMGVNRNQIISTTCCTVGMFYILKLLHLLENDEVIIPSIGFVGAANAVADSGAKIVFCDVDPRTLNTTLELVREKVTSRTRAILLIHYGGFPVQDIFAIKDFCDRSGIYLIEDSACSVASKYNGEHCGAIGNFGAFSFDAMKILVCGDGSMVFCRDPKDREKLDKMLYLGLETKSGLSSTVDSKWWEFEISSYSSRNILNDISSAMGIEQLKKLNGFIARRKEVWDRYNDGLKKESEWISLPPPPVANTVSSYYFYWIQTEPKYRDAMAKYLKENGVYTTFRYYPLHKVNLYGHNGALVNSEQASKTTLCLPIHQSLTNGDVDRIIDLIGAFRKK